MNLIALIALAGGITYLDSFRGRQIDARRVSLRVNAALMADALASDPMKPEAMLARFGRRTATRILMFAPDGRLTGDSWQMMRPTFALVDPRTEPLERRFGWLTDRIVDAFSRMQPVPVVRDLPAGPIARWPEAGAALAGNHITDGLRRAPDGTFILSSAAPVPGQGVLLIAANPREITYAVREERLLAIRVFLVVLGFSAVLSTYLGRTIVLPLRRLGGAAALVRAGRERGVVVPRLPKRYDEIGQLARAVSDMTTALRTRIDATEAFAAEVAHELKNPLASLRSALETLPKVKDAHRRASLMDVMTDDVVRLDRLIGDIAEASRLEAQISRSRFAPVDLNALAAEVTTAAPKERGVAVVSHGFGMALGDAGRLRQVAQNLVDNAVTFSPDNGYVRVLVERRGARTVLMVEDEGPGVPPAMAERIFDRFYTERPNSEAFGLHSGLGLAIARAIVEAHGGTITVENRAKGGARFIVSLQAA